VSDKRLEKELLGAVARFARSRGLPKPTTHEGWQALMGQFMQQQPTWDEIPDERPLHLGVNGAGVQILDPLHGPPSDFDELIEQREAALVEGGGDDLARDAIMQQQNHAALTAAAPFMRSNPPSVLSGTLGGQVTVQPAKELKTVAFWQGDDPETTCVTITLVPVQQISSVNVIAGLRPFARIAYGTKGFSAVAEVDIHKGVQLSISGSQVRVDVGMDEDNNGDGTSMIVAGMLSFGPVLKANAATRTVYVDNFANGGTLKSVLVPAFAKRFMIATSPNNGGAGGYIFACRDNASQFVYQQVVAAGSAMVGPFDLSGDVNDIQLDNTGTGQIFQRVIFELSL
jgi:hypothetical protein